MQNKDVEVDGEKQRFAGSVSTDLRMMVQRFSDFESRHAVDEYVCNGIRVWPIIRTWLSSMAMVRPCRTGKREALRFNERYVLSEPSNNLATRLAMLRRLFSSSYRRIYEYHALLHALILPHLADRRNYRRADKGPVDVVILASANRRLLRNGVFVHPLADPVIEMLESRGLRTALWEHGEKWPRSRPSAWISHALRWRLRRQGRSIPQEPQWFSDVVLLGRALGVTAKWVDVYARRLLPTFVYADIFEEWLASCYARAIIVECWYSNSQMAAVIAGKRLGLRTVDWQHGWQGHKHDSYNGWVRSPTLGYEMIPELFWCWGEMDAVSLRANNALPSRVIAGGNLWLNQWQQDSLASERTKQNSTNREKTILVTLTVPAFENYTALFHEISLCPSDWKWILRTHPKERCSRSRFEQVPPNVTVRHASESSLHDQLLEADVNVTRHSTSAYEALAFGKPSIICDDIGMSIYEDMINNGVMIVAREYHRLSEAIFRCEDIRPDDCRQQARKVFSSPCHSRHALDALARWLKGENEALEGFESNRGSAIDANG